MIRRPASRSGRWPLATRSRALFVALLVATTGYAVLMGGIETSRLAVRGTIDTNAATAAYDILVRPKDTRLPLEASDQLVQPGFLDGLTGSIMTAQWHEIEGISGVEVAVPVALIGWTMPFVAVPIDLTPFAHITEPILLRRNTTRTYDNGASTVAQTPLFMYVTPNPVRMVFPNLQANPEDFDPAHWVETKPDGTEVRFDIAGTNRPPRTVSEGQPMFSVISTAEIAEPRPGTRTLDVLFPFPSRLAAIDPEAEAKLSGLDRALVSGTYLTKGTEPTRIFPFSGGQSDIRTPVPVLVGDAAPARLSAAYGLEVIHGPLVDLLARRGALGPEGYDKALNRELIDAHGTPSGSGTFDSDTAYRDLLDAMATPATQGKYYARSVLRIQSTSWAILTADASGRFVPAPAEDGDLVWGVSDLTGDVADSVISPGGDDARLRTLAGHFASPALNPPAGQGRRFRRAQTSGQHLARAGAAGHLRLHAGAGRGRREPGDPARCALAPGDQSDRLSRLASADVDHPRSRGRFRRRARVVAARLRGDRHTGAAAVNRRPLSAIRVRVAGVSGVGPVDRERVRVVAEDIARLTGLDVDITMGSSPGPQRIAVPTGAHERPAMTVTQLWVTKGVAARLMTAVDRKSLLLNWVVLAASGLVVANAVFASVRARRREIGTARAVGWTRLAVLRHVLVPVLSAAVGAGLAGLVLAVVVRVLLAGSGVAGGQRSAARGRHQRGRMAHRRPRAARRFRRRLARGAPAGGLCQSDLPALGDPGAAVTGGCSRAAPRAVGHRACDPICGGGTWAGRRGPAGRARLRRPGWAHSWRSRHSFTAGQWAPCSAMRSPSRCGRPMSRPFSSLQPLPVWVSRT